MQIKADARRYEEIECDALVIWVFEGEKPDDGLLGKIDRQTGGVIGSLIEMGEFSGKPGESAYIHNTGQACELRARRLLLLGAGKQAEVEGETLRKIAGSATRTLRGKKARTIAFLRRSAEGLVASAQALTEGILLSLFEPDKYHSKDKIESRLDLAILTAVEGDREELERGIERGRIIAEATNFGRDIINEPANVLTPIEMANRATEMAKEYGLEIDLLGEERMKELGMGALLGVAQGSEEPARLIVMTWTPSVESEETIAIVGKGITFDTGGISIKPSDGMEKMKYDMAGGATTIAAMRAIAQLKPTVLSLIHI